MLGSKGGGWDPRLTLKKPSRPGVGTGRGRAFDRLVELEVVGWLETHMLMTLLPFPERMLLEHSWGNADVLDTGLGK